MDKYAYLDGYLQKVAKEEKTKYGPVISEILAGIPATSIPLVGPVSYLTGSIGAAVTDTRSAKEQEKRKHTIAQNFLPGVGVYNYYKRLGRTAKDYKESPEAKREGAPKNSKLMSEYLGLLTSAAGTMTAGAAIGLAIQKAIGGDIGKGAVVGTMAGAGAVGLGTLAGAGKALVDKRRNTKEQMEYESNPTQIANYLVPGTAVYNLYKRLGYSTKYDA